MLLEQVYDGLVKRLLIALLEYKLWDLNSFWCTTM